MTFRMVTIECDNCNKVLGATGSLDSIYAIDAGTSQFYCPNCVAVIQELRYTLGNIDRQDYAKALMDEHFHSFTPKKMIDNRRNSAHLQIKRQSYAYWHVQMWQAVKQWCEKQRD